MQDLSEINSLIDLAATAAGSDYKVAQQIGVQPQAISNWRHGSAPCPVENVALIAQVAGLDPVAEMARAVVRKHEGTAKGDRLMKALGKALLATGAVSASVGAHATVISSWTNDTLAHLIRCVLCKLPDATNLLAVCAASMGTTGTFA